MIDGLFSAAADAAIRVTLLAVAIAAILALFRIRSSAARHAAWTAVLLAMLLMPLLSRVVPSLRIPVPDPLTLRIKPQAVDPAVARTALSQAESVRVAVPAASSLVPVAPSGDARRPSSSAPAKPFPWRTTLLSAYCIGVVFFLARLLIGVIHLWQIRRHGRPVPSAGREVYESSALATPVTVGFVKARVVLPVGWRQWPADMLSAVIAHERAHASRRDPLTALLARVNCALYWFHPLAWWLERQLSTNAEHACDDAAVKVVTRRRYAETLLEIAATVRRHRGRLVWQAVGVDSGQLGHRIDRVLSATGSPALSRTRLALVSASCAVMIAAAVACRGVKAAPLRENPQVAAEIRVQQEESRERQAFYEAADKMTRGEATALERVLAQNPEDAVTREKLLTFYGRNKAEEDWKFNAMARRPHALWLIQHHPESELAMRARVSEREDPDGYAQARKLWLAAIARPDASPIVLTHAARFFEASEKQMSEEILRRGLSQQPAGPEPRPAYYRNWKWQLGTMYAYAIIGAQDDDPDLKWARKRLEQSNDAQVLFAAGYDLSWRPTQTERKQFGRQVLERASQLDPRIAERVRALLYQRDVLNASGAFGGTPPREWPALLEKSTGLEKLRQLAALSQQQYMMAEYFDWLSRQPESVRRSAGNRNGATPEQDAKTAAENFDRVKTYARQAIDLASSVNEPGAAEAAFRAHIACGLVELREGDRKNAVSHLLEASKLPAPPEEPVGGWASGSSIVSSFIC